MINSRAQMNRKDTAKPTRIGMIWPDTGEQLELFEMANKDLLNGLAATDYLEFDVAYSTGPEGHSVEALQNVGSVDAIADAGALLVGRGCDVVVWACTSGSFIGGFQWCLEQRHALSKRIGKPVTSGSLALVSGILRQGYEVVDILSPYPEDVTDIFCTYLKDAGITVGAVRMLHSPGATASALLSLKEECHAFAHEGNLAGDVVLIPDTAVNSLSMIPDLEEALGRPVLTVNQVCVSEGAALAGCLGDLTDLPAFRCFRGSPEEKIL